MFKKQPSGSPPLSSGDGHYGASATIVLRSLSRDHQRFGTSSSEISADPKEAMLPTREGGDAEDGGEAGSLTSVFWEGCWYCWG
ncbi:hypothetical protein CDAR_89001 [Caerostris darwini]|uniref:Uncharacterized protein n=1 Tax=Caerostris darwini TaxID=1538125 RepID=A0AAV4UZS9_9ARAC|nr:hypothetical protein CDAR_89001 [Caerostris darwini]